MKLPRLTNKQQEIVELLYVYRFLNRVQIQQLMGHKDKKTINVWLRDLKIKQYITWIYSPNDFALKTKPAIYYIALNGVRYLKTLHTTDGSALYPIEDIRKRYRESSRSHTFIDHRMLVADCCMTLLSLNKSVITNTDTHSVEYKIFNVVTYSHPQSPFYFIHESELINPDLFYTEHETFQKEGKTRKVTTNYFLEVFDATMPRYRIKKRLSNYIAYLSEGEWESETNDLRPPNLLLVCPRISDLIYAKRRTRGLLADVWDDDLRKKLHVQFTVIDELKNFGIMGEIWEQA